MRRGSRGFQTSPGLGSADSAEVAGAGAGAGVGRGPALAATGSSDLGAGTVSDPVISSTFGGSLEMDRHFAPAR